MGYSAKTSLVGTSEKTPLKKQGQERHSGRTANYGQDREKARFCDFGEVQMMSASFEVFPFENQQIVTVLNGAFRTKNGVLTKSKKNRR